MKKLIYLTVILLITDCIHAQCDKYRVTGIRMVGDTLMDITFINSGDPNVYLSIAVINSAGDTIAANNCFCGAILPIDSPSVQRLQSYVASVPPFGTFRVAMTNFTLTCDSVAQDFPLDAYSLGEQAAFSVYPNPAVDLINVRVGLFQGQNIRYVIFDSHGQLVKEDHLGTSKLIPVEELRLGSYLLQLNGDRGYLGNTVFIKQ